MNFVKNIRRAIAGEGAIFICGKARYRAYSPLSPRGDIPPPGGGQEMLFYGKLRANVDARKRVLPQRMMPQTKIASTGEECGAFYFGRELEMARTYL